MFQLPRPGAIHLLSALRRGGPVGASVVKTIVYKLTNNEALHGRGGGGEIGRSNAMGGLGKDGKPKQTAHKAQSS